MTISAVPGLPELHQVQKRPAKIEKFSKGGGFGLPPTQDSSHIFNVSP